MVEEVNVKRYKVASRSVDDKELIEALIETKTFIDITGEMEWFRSQSTTQVWI